MFTMQFFDDEDDSADGRSEKQRVILDGIKNQKRDTECPSNQCDDDLEEDKGCTYLSDDLELERLRCHPRYQMYADRKEKKMNSTSGELTVQGSLEESRLTCNEGGHQAALDQKLKKTSSPLPRLPAKSVKRQMFYEEKDDCRKVSLPPSKKRRARVPGVDPKIVDDSSSEDVSSSEDELCNETATLHGDNPRGSVPFSELPVGNVAKLGASHTSYVTALTIDNAGNRMVSVSLDCSAKIWDFNSMNSSMIPFRTRNPLGNSPLRSIEYSRSGGFLLCSGRNNVAVVMDRDGSVLSKTSQGDMYIVDSSRTKGHTASILSAKWQQNLDLSCSRIATTSADGTVRLWDVKRTSRTPLSSSCSMAQISVKKLRDSRGGRITATAFDWMHDSPNGVFGCSDGTVKVMDPWSNSFRSKIVSPPAVARWEEITSVCCSPSSCAQPLLLVRSTDDCLRVYDMRKLEDPVMLFRDLPNSISETNCCFIGSTGDFFATGTSATRRGGGSGGSVRAFSRKEMRQVWASEMEDDTQSVISILWKQSLNQIIIGTSSGKVLVHYDEHHSRRGVLSCLTRTTHRKIHGVASLGVDVAVPSSSVPSRHGLLSADLSKRNTDPPCLLLNRKDVYNVSRPGPSVIPKRDHIKSATLAEHIAKRAISTEHSKNPREAILEHAEAAARSPMFTKAYHETQPQTLLADKTAEQDEEDSKKAIYERDMLTNDKNRTVMERR